VDGVVMVKVDVWLREVGVNPRSPVRAYPV